VENDWSHTSHGYGLSPVCVLRCAVEVPLRANDLSNTSHKNGIFHRYASGCVYLLIACSGKRLVTHFARVRLVACVGQLLLNQMIALTETLAAHVVWIQLCFGLACPLITGGIIHFGMTSITRLTSTLFHAIERVMLNAIISLNIIL